MKRYNDLLVIDALVGVLAVLVSISQVTALRVILGIPAVFFFPGYVLTAALFPKRTGPGRTERIALSIGASTAAVILIGLFLNYTSWGITITSTSVSVLVFTVVISIVAGLRRRRLADGGQTAPEFAVSLSWWRKAAGIDRALMLALAVSVVLALGASVYVSARPKPGDAFTEFYLLNPTGMAEKYTRQMALGREYELVLGIANRERQENSYRIEIRLDGVQKDEIGPVVLASGEKRELKVKYVPDTLGDNQKLEFLLFKTEQSEPYTTLYLRIYVNPR